MNFSEYVQAMGNFQPHSIMFEEVIHQTRTKNSSLGKPNSSASLVTAIAVTYTEIGTSTLLFNIVSLCFCGHVTS